jgi:hypothetical protein
MSGSGEKSPRAENRVLPVGTGPGIHPDWIGIRWIGSGEESAVGTGWGPGIHSDRTGIRLCLLDRHALDRISVFLLDWSGSPGLGNGGLGCGGLRTWWTADVVD